MHPYSTIFKDCHMSTQANGILNSTDKKWSSETTIKTGRQLKSHTSKATKI